MPSFSLVLTSATGETLAALQDSDCGMVHREVHLQLPSVSPTDDDPLMNSIDTRFPGQLAYGVTYSTKKGEENDEDDDDRSSDAGTFFEPCPFERNEVEHDYPPLRSFRHSRTSCPSSSLKLFSFRTFWFKLRRFGALLLCSNV